METVHIVVVMPISQPLLQLTETLPWLVVSGDPIYLESSFNNEEMFLILNN